MIEKMQKNFQKNEKNSVTLFCKLRAACDGLIYTSETDSPVAAFAGSKTSFMTRESILRQIGRKAEEQIEEIGFAEFFNRLTVEKEWFGSVEILMAQKFFELQKLFEENLHDNKVLKVGRIQLDIYVVGIDKTGQLLGVTTKAVET